MAEYQLVPSPRFLVPLPEGLDPASAAPLTDAGLTPYHAVRRSWPQLVPGSTVVVIGVGGLGHMAVQILRPTTAARVVAVDTRPDALHVVAGYGAEITMLSDDTTRDAIRAATGRRGADVVLDFVGADATLALRAAVARMGGDLTLVGVAGGALSLSFFSVPYELSVQTTYWGSRPELVEVLDLAARKLVEPKITLYRLDEAMDAYRAMAAGETEGRAVVVPG